MTMRVETRGEKGKAEEEIESTPEIHEYYL